MTVPLKPLGIIKEMLDGIGLQITYAYDDLIFVEHNAFLLQMGQSGEVVRLYFNTESSKETRDDISNLLKECGRQYKFVVERRGTYTLLQNAQKNELQIQFFNGCL